MNKKISYIVSIFLILISVYFTYLYFYPNTTVSEEYSVNSPTTMFLTEKTKPNVYVCILPGIAGIVFLFVVKRKE